MPFETVGRGESRPIDMKRKGGGGVGSGSLDGLPPRHVSRKTKGASSVILKKRAEHWCSEFQTLPLNAKEVGVLHMHNQLSKKAQNSIGCQGLILGVITGSEHL